MRKIQVLILVVCSWLLRLPALAQHRAARLDSLFQQLHHAGRFNGGVLLAEQGRVIYQHAFGYADLPTRTPNALASRFQLASVSKTFTSTAVLQLLEQGKIKLDAPLARYLPAFPYPTITLRHLLTHTSGLPDLELYEPLAREQSQLVVSNQDIIPALHGWSRGLYFLPGTQWSYCNTNYLLLAMLVEQISHLPFGTYLQRHIFQPARMADTYLRTPARLPDPHQVSAHVLPTLYATRPEPVATVQVQDSIWLWHLRFETSRIAGTLGAHNVVSTLADMLRFDQALYAGWLLRPSTLTLATTPARLNDGSQVDAGVTEEFGGSTSYGLGWVVRHDPILGQVVGHDGYDRGIATTFYHNVTKNQTVIAFDNTETPQFPQKIAAAIQLLNGQPLVIPKEKQSAARVYGAALLRHGPARALVQLNTLRADTAHYYLREKELNRLGYDFLHNGYPTQSVEVFKLNTILFPASFNTYDSYGEACRNLGLRSEALLLYQRALSLNPASKGTQEALRRLLALPH